jgi:hypothetical protein
MRTTLTLCLVALLTACGGGGSDAPEQPKAEPPYTNLVVIGNSLSLHARTESIGWLGDWGMGASALEKDFVHVAATALGVPVLVTNQFGLERADPATIADIPNFTASIKVTSAVAIQLAENVPNQGMGGSAEIFRPAYGALLDAVKHAKGLACLSSWTNAVLVDAVIQAECTARQGVYVYIGDIKTMPDNPETGKWYGHPEDWSMAIIGARVAAALK